ncbi:MAG: GNAT family N-acetyltransferase [Pseudomonadota bacterium]
MNVDNIEFRFAEQRDEAQVLALLPRLHAFPVHERRNPRDLWVHDAETAKKLLHGNAPASFLIVADASPKEDESTVAGLVMVTMQGEFMSHEPGSHLEALVVADGYEGLGLGRRLMDGGEAEARKRGAESITLHVFNSNERAAALYRRQGYEFEMQRCIKWF